MKPIRTTVALALAALLVAGCGGSSNSGGSSATSSGSSTPATASTAATTPAANTGTGNSSSSGTPSFASSANCLQLASVGAKVAQAMSSTTTGGKFDLQNAVKAYKALADGAPDPIKPDLEVTANAFAAFAAALAKANYTPGQVPDASQVAALEAAVQTLNQAKLQAAEKHISDWAAQNCG